MEIVAHHVDHQAKVAVVLPVVKVKGIVALHAAMKQAKVAVVRHAVMGIAVRHSDHQAKVVVVHPVVKVKVAVAPHAVKVMGIVVPHVVMAQAKVAVAHHAVKGMEIVVLLVVMAREKVVVAHHAVKEKGIVAPHVVMAQVKAVVVRHAVKGMGIAVHHADRLALVGHVSPVASAEITSTVMGVHNDHHIDHKVIQHRVARNGMMI